MSDEGSAEEHLATDSNALLSELRGLREQEDRKRRTTISSPEFHVLADDVERRARRVWQTARDERETGNETHPTHTTTDEVSASLEGDGGADDGDGGDPPGDA